MIRCQLGIQVHDVPAQLNPIRTQYPHTFTHPEAFPLPYRIESQFGAVGNPQNAEKLVKSRTQELDYRPLRRHPRLLPF
jgi:hypothetical protein